MEINIEKHFIKNHSRSVHIIKYSNCIQWFAIFLWNVIFNISLFISASKHKSGKDNSKVFIHYFTIFLFYNKNNFEQKFYVANNALDPFHLFKPQTD